MAHEYTIGVGTVGGGLSISHDGGEVWTRIRTPLPSECNVRTLQVYPDNPRRIIAGTDVGVYRSEDNGTTWGKLPSPMEELQIWSVAVDPVHTDTLFVGTRPAGFRSRDGGKTWEELAMGVNLNCPIGTPRTTNMIVDPRDHQTIWAGIEVDGVYKSQDGGRTWSLALRPGQPTALFATSPFGIATSTDEGESWAYHYFPKFHPEDARSYCRGIAFKADDPNVMFVGNGDSIPGLTGAIQISRDGGRSWSAASLPVEPNSVIYWFATHAALPNVIVAASLYGYVYVSEDGGASWSKRQREFGEIRALALTPN
jgi:photosystem II stability/assembly factor-like uncharacterized protein